MVSESKLIRTFIVMWGTSVAPFMVRDFGYNSYDAEKFLRIVKSYPHLTVKPTLRTQCRYI